MATNPNRSNPFGSNGTTSDPREKIMWDFYVEGLAQGKENAYEAAIKSGYSEDHARNITIQGWFKERKDKLRRKDMLSKAERNLDSILDLDVTDKEIDSRLLSIKADVSKTVAKTLGKETYSERSELTGKDGKDLMPKPILAYVIPSNESNEEGNGNEEETPVHTGGNISE